MTTNLLDNFEIFNAECEKCAETIINGNALCLGDLCDVSVTGEFNPPRNLRLATDVAGGSTFLGIGSGLKIFSGTAGGSSLNNTFLGWSAGALTVNAGSGNTFVGNSSGNSNTTGFSNTYLGDSSGKTSDAASSYNTFVGSLAGGSSIGNENVYVGYLAGQQSAPVGKSNLATSNVFVGRGAGQFNTGTNNTVMGWNAAQNIGPGITDTTAIGYLAGRNINFSFCTVVGSGAGSNLLGGGANTSLGYNALAGFEPNAAGTFGNVAVGNSAGRNLNSNSSLNVIIGSNCLDANNGVVANEVSESVVIGQGALRGLTATALTNNVVIGRQAGQFLQNLGGGPLATGSDNVIIGRFACDTATGAARNVIIGSNAAPLMTGSGSGTCQNVFIGNAVAPTFTGSNVNVGSHVWIGNNAGVGLMSDAAAKGPSIIIGDSLPFSSPTNFLNGNNIAIGSGIDGGDAASGTYEQTTFLGYQAGFGVNPIRSSALYIQKNLFQATSTNLQYNSATGLVSQPVSSLRYKQNVRDLEVDSAKLFNLVPKSFEYKAPREEVTDFGFIAEEVALELPLLVSLDSENLPASVRYDLLTPLLLNELKKLRSEFNNYVLTHP